MDIKSLVAGIVVKTSTIKMSKPWDKTVYIRELTSGEMDILANFQKEHQSEIKTMAKTVCLGVIDKEGESVFTSKTSDINDLLKMPTSDLLKVGGAIMELTQEDIEKDPKV